MLVLFDDGRTMPLGTMGGEGRLQTQGAVFTRHARFGSTLKLDSRFDPARVAGLRAAGHDVEVLAAPFSDTLGHAGALVRHPDGRIEGAADPRSDGAACGVRGCRRRVPQGTRAAG